MICEKQSLEILSLNYHKVFCFQPHTVKIQGPRPIFTLEPTSNLLFRRIYASQTSGYLLRKLYGAKYPEISNTK